MKTIQTLLIALAATSPLYGATNINWMDLSIFTDGGNIFTPSNFNLPGYGSVTVSYAPAPLFPISSPSGFFTRNASGIADNGSITVGPDTYQWTDLDFIFGVNGTASEPAITWDVTFTFNDGPADNIVVGIWGLGHKPTQGSTEITMNQGGTELGQYDIPSVTTAPLSASITSSSITVVNSVTQPTPGAGNSHLGIYELSNSALTTLTLSAVSHISEDGLGFNIGVVPEPTAFGGVMGLAALMVARRQRHAA